MKNHALITIFLCFAVFGMASSAKADLGYELNVSHTYTDNLLEDSSNVSDNYTIVRGGLTFFPLASTKLSIASEYTRYKDLSGLSNLLTNIGLTFIPTVPESRLQLFLSGNFNGRIYKDDFRNFSSKNDFDAVASLSYRIKPTLQIRAGLKHTASIYTNAPVDDKYTYELFAGANLTAMNRTSIDLEFGYSSGNYQYYDRALDSGNVEISASDVNNPRYAFNLLHDGDLQFFYISPRLSQQVGEKLGISITYQHRSFIDVYNQAIIYGYSTGLLSPWTSSYEGDAISISMKSYHISGSIVTMGAGVWSRKHIETLDYWQHLDVFTGEIVSILTTYGGEEGRGGAFDREDDRSRIYLNIQHPVPDFKGLFWESNFKVEYVDNSSNGPVYEYHYWSFSFGLKTQF